MSFVATANSLDPIPAPLLDRCEVVEVEGLTAAERLEVAHSHLWPRLLDAYGLARQVVPLSAGALDLVVTGYAAPGEAGLRSVETRIESLLHRAIAQGAPTRRVWITPEVVEARLGKRPEGEVQRRAVGSGRHGRCRGPRAWEVCPRCRGSGRQSLGCGSIPGAGVWGAVRAGAC